MPQDRFAVRGKQQAPWDFGFCSSAVGRNGVARIVNRDNRAHDRSESTAAAIQTTRLESECRTIRPRATERTLAGGPSGSRYTSACLCCRNCRAVEQLGPTTLSGLSANRQRKISRADDIRSLRATRRRPLTVTYDLSTVSPTSFNGRSRCENERGFPGVRCALPQTGQMQARVASAFNVVGPLDPTTRQRFRSRRTLLVPWRVTSSDRSPRIRDVNSDRKFALRNATAANESSAAPHAFIRNPATMLHTE